MRLKPSDYTYILRYYNESIPLTRKKTIHRRETKKKALRLLKRKLCSCKKKLQQRKIKESRSIAICTKSVLNNKGFSPYKKYSCKNTRTKQQLLPLKRNKKYTRRKKPV